MKRLWLCIMLLALAVLLAQPVLGGDYDCGDDTCCHKIENPGNTVTWTSPEGTVINSGKIKSGENMGEDKVVPFSADGIYEECYAVSGIGTRTVTVARIGDGPGCQEISFVMFICCQEPTPEPTVTNTPEEPTPTEEPTVTRTPDPTSTPTEANTPTNTPDPTVTTTPTKVKTKTPRTPDPTATNTPTVNPTITPTLWPTPQCCLPQTGGGLDLLRTLNHYAPWWPIIPLGVVAGIIRRRRR